MAHVSDLIASDIDAYLESHQHKSLLRFITCGSVDDGKSTLIGRLLYDSKMIFEDQMAALEADSKRVGTQGGEIDFALLVDGLAAEREQGITIDVAYRFFSTDKRKFIVADTPGHEQYTRNMVTGASTADLAIILIDARKGILTQTRRHSFLVNLIGIRKVVLAVNKMDLVGFDQVVFDTIVADYRVFAGEIGLTDILAIPISGLKGDNIASKSQSTPWYQGPTLVHYLETVEIDEERLQAGPFRMPVQWVNRPNLDFRGFSGQIASGMVRPGDAVRVLPSGRETPDRAHRHQGRRPAPGGRRPIGHPDLRRRGRLLARRRDRRGQGAHRGRRPVRDHHRVDGRRADAARPRLRPEDRGHDGHRAPSPNRNTRSTSTRWNIWRPGNWSSTRSAPATSASTGRSPSTPMRPTTISAASSSSTG